MKNKLTNFISLMAVIVVIVGVSVVVQTVAREAATPTPQEVRQQLQPADRLSGIERQSFLRYCNVDGDIQAYCECTLKYLEDRMTASQIRALDAQVTADSLPDVMWRAIDACAPLITIEGDI
jgi:hypothetical protein